MRLKNRFYFFLSLLISFNAIACNRHITPKVIIDNKDISSNTMIKDILMYVNEHRKSIGLPELQLMDIASSESYKHSEDMASRKTGFGHDGFDDRMNTISKNAGGLSAMAENVAYGHLDAKEVVDLWINSPPHKKNMEGNYNYTGIGISQTKDGTIYFTQIFVRK